MTTRLVTTEELLQAPTGFDWQDVADNVGAGSSTEVVEQLRVIDRASDEACRYIFNSVDARVNATSDTETRRLGPTYTNCYVDRIGTLIFRTSFFPILQVTAFQWALAPPGVPLAGPNGVVYNTVATNGLLIYGEGTRKRRIHDNSQDYTWLRSGAVVQSSYTNGWPNAVIGTGGAAAGSNVNILVDDSTGFAAAGSGQPQNIGANPTIYDGVNTERVTVTAVPDSTHVTVATLAFTHAAGVGISDVPPALKWGVILACTHFGRFRGSDAVSFVGSGGATRGEVHQSMDALMQAYAMWDEFKIRS